MSPLSLMRIGGQWSALRLAGEVISALLTAVFLALNAAQFQQINSRGKEVDWRWLALLAFIVFVVLIYWRVLQQQAEVNRFRKSRAPLEVYFDPEDIAMQWPEEHWYRIGVRNNSRFVQSRDTIAVLERMAPYPLPFKALPSKLTLKDGGISTTINPEGFALWDVMSRVPQTERTLAIYTQAAPGQPFELDPDLEYELQIVVSAANHEEPKPTTVIVRHPLGQDPQFSIRADTTQT